MQKLHVNEQLEEKFCDFIFHRHDTYCNQKYSKDYPYSIHLKSVAMHGKQFIWDGYSPTDKESNAILFALYGHDLIEDARMTYNDIVDLKYRFIKDGYGLEVEEFNLAADIIYACTEEKGKNRDARHSDKFWNELLECKFAVFVKLCDLSANIKFSTFMKSSMLHRYGLEWPRVSHKLKRSVSVDHTKSNYEFYKTIITEIENILSLCHI